ncbi:MULTISPECIES: carboxyl-terminal processing protease CtpA [Okeania]|uniref:Carboxyl-terminal-processing protease n=1 Tax=Okeania hirsuta TaxID=1458930 RepID=A0A3N6QSI0_9CYAN|nr:MULTISPECIES: carboxyl-terminal processing protease CtpA [Okeania]NES75469.1 PDZ domain-containing protein [Okeania sp. SIO1H4]NES88218.1 PDZ domain-containing protein [Okeania sp. SIO2B9]NET17892.1 PDZ domain-containing protein [Okeania sp. SIO1H5]NET77287.1 PDZ domain-containing protein [Okeania sp. SIO1F9]NET92752.1 PDZ domain-containing protein [Okeania sp. SIO1H2]
MKKRFIRIIFLLILPVILSGGFWTSSASALTEEQSLLGEAWRIVNLAYVDDSFNHQNWWFVRQKLIKKPLENRDDTYNAIQEMLASLEDPFTRLLKPEQYNNLQVNTSGELTGVGLQIALDPQTGELIVISPLESSPAEAAGIQPRDRVLKIDGQSTSEFTLDEAANRMRGPVGSSVVLTILTESNDQPQEIKLIRDTIEINPVYAELKYGPETGKIGYIRLSQFNANAATEVSQAVESFEQQGVIGYVLDLRNNPGGLLQAGIEIARLWLDDGTIVYTVNRQRFLGSFSAEGLAITDSPLVVLTNQGTASASEILAGALQDNGRALLVGEKTFGKGLIQSLFDLSDGSGLAVTVAKYETPNHTDINKQGIMPDVVVEEDPIWPYQITTEADKQYQAAVEILTSEIALANAA